MASFLVRRVFVMFAVLVAAVLSMVTAGGPAMADEDSFDQPEGLAAACSTTSTGGTTKVNYDGRYYLIRVPAGIPSSGAPLVVVVHGGYGTPEGVEGDSGWDALGDQNKAIVVYPRGSKSEGSGWGWNADAGSADITHITKVVANVRAKYCVDAKRIHLSGHSNGGQMASRVACTNAGLFASGAVYAPAPPPVGCDPSRALSWAVFASAGDTTVIEPVAYSTVTYWSWENRPCGNEQSDGGANGIKDSKQWTCDAGTHVLWRVYNNGSHDWPTGARHTEVLNRMWKFLKDNPRP
ncbi:alpha/beta hydrolase family esterase [Nocardia jejuensis]|uniref:alpha/beta hydrolase family esterase n=1 Tax=Nocardia jejuensis TaxID=328049 RepID=UPI000A599B90|nr:PHB depolymerase family esterase [Nocardia jejuensis]